MVGTDVDEGAGKYHVRYDDGDEERMVPRDRIFVQCSSDIPDQDEFLDVGFESKEAYTLSASGLVRSEPARSTASASGMARGWASRGRPS